MNTVDKINLILKEANISKVNLAKYLGVSRQMVYNYLDSKDLKEQDKPINTKIVDKEYSVKERKQNIRSILHQKHKVKFQELFNEYNRPYLIVTFLSVLEMTKDKEIIIRQERNFDDILIEEVV